MNPTHYNPYACFPSSGWRRVKTKTITVHPEDYLEPVELNYMLVQNGEVFLTVLHWYQSVGNKILKSGIDQNIQRSIGRVLYNRNDDAFVRDTVDTDSTGTDAGEELTITFAKKILALLPQ